MVGVQGGRKWNTGCMLCNVNIPNPAGEIASCSQEVYRETFGKISEQPNLVSC